MHTHTHAHAHTRARKRTNFRKSTWLAKRGEGGGRGGGREEGARDSEDKRGSRRERERKKERKLLALLAQPKEERSLLFKKEFYSFGTGTGSFSLSWATQEFVFTSRTK